MSVKDRVELCRLIEKMNERKDCSKRLGLVNVSTFRGEQIKEQR